MATPGLALTYRAVEVNVRPVGPRFPFPSFPRGWFVVAFSSDVAAGQVKTVHYFGQDIVLFRGQNGVLTALDKTCPHLGAHLGGGRVDGNCLRCPFHAWAFDDTGRCVDVPYAPKVPPKAAARTWRIKEQNGVVFVFYCPRGEAPSWEVPPLGEDGWTPSRTIRWEIRSHPQEIAENTVDITHLGPVHHTHAAEILEHEQRGHFMRVLLQMTANGAPIQMPDEINDVELDVVLHGLGSIVSSTHVLTAGLRTRQRIYPTPIDADRVAIFGMNSVKAMPDPGYTREIDEIFFQAFVSDFERDFPIWENKAYLERPLLAGGDGPIGRYRRWARQFYEGPTDSESLEASETLEASDAAGAAETSAAPVRALRGWLSRLVRRGPAESTGAGGSPAPREEAPAAPSANGSAAANGTPHPAAARTTPRSTAAKAIARFGSVEAYFESLEARFDRNAAGDLEAVFQWVLTGQDARAHFASVKEGTIRVESGVHPAPTVAIEMSASDYLQLINGELSGPLAFSTGRGKLRGPVRLAMKMQKLFPLDRAV
jgi:nitrite reductase/ring-hydroxylating ferredoxin subunit/putative sterol carrier protein